MKKNTYNHREELQRRIDAGELEWNLNYADTRESDKRNRSKYEKCLKKYNKSRNEVTYEDFMLRTNYNTYMKDNPDMKMSYEQYCEELKHNPFFDCE